MKLLILSIILLFNLSCQKEEKKTEFHSGSEMKMVSVSTNPLENIFFMTEEYPPFNYEINGESSGFGVDIWVEVFKEMKLGLSRKDIHIYPWARGYKNVQNPQKRNMLFLMGRTAQREPLFKWVGPLPGNEYALITYKGGPKPKSIEEIKNEEIVAIRKDIGGLALLELGFPKKNLKEVGQLVQLFRMVKMKRLNFFSYGLIDLKEKVEKEGLNWNDFEIALKFKKSKLYYAFNKSIEDETVQKYQDALTKVMADKALLKKIKDKYSKMGVYVPL